MTRRICLILAVISLIGCSNAVHNRDRVCFQGRCVRVEVVQKKEELERGLQFRKSLGKEEGMLFVFPRSQIYSFWMKDTLIPLDMIWLDYSQKVVHIERNVPPCRSDPCGLYTPSAEALYV